MHAPLRCYSRSCDRLALDDAAGAGLRLPLKDGSVKFAVIGDTGTGDSHQLAIAKAARRVPVRKFPFEFVVMMGDNLYGGDSAEGLREEVREPVQAAARRRREVLRVARQPRQPERAALQAVQHERRALLHVQARRSERPVLRARQQLHRRQAAGLARQGARGQRIGLEDLLLPPSAVFVRRDARVGRACSANSSSRSS